MTPKKAARVANDLSPGIIERFALTEVPGHSWTPFMGGYVVPTGALPAEVEVNAHEAIYDAAIAALDPADDAAVEAMNTKDNKTIRDTLWEFHQAIRGATPLPDETKNAFSSRLKDARASYE